MYLYNTLTKKKEEFIPHNNNEVTLYTCGPTVYHYAHIGNLRTYISEDILEKALKYLGYNVKRCMNITDVGHNVGDSDDGEDKMTLASEREHKSALEIAKFYTDAFHKDCDKLNIKWPEIVSNATDNIDFYIKMIEKLLKEDYAYIADGNVYFDTSKFKKYYELSGRNPEELSVAVRSDIEVDTSKKNPFDFGLWFTNSKFNNQELQWDSPWGRGYPGWHIECSSIAIKNLGEYLDIHCGAEDAVFPHHTNEIAQSECYLGHKWCNYWVHLGFLNDKEGKMSKSKGEFLTVSLLEEKGYDPLAYRYLCLTSPYRKQLSFSYDILEGASNQYKKLKQRVLSLTDSGEYIEEDFNNYNNKFKECLSNDLNTSSAITVLFDLLKDNNISDKTKKLLVESFDKVLSLDLLKEEVVDTELDSYIKEMIELRSTAKKNKDYNEADRIRNELLDKGIELIDTREGTTYKIK